jgi:hypothetical protein
VDQEIFITYSSKDQKVARTICTALENRGLACWISSRNIKPGQNYQEQIVKAIRAAKIMVLVFTANANNSDEIKKELALASQNKLVVIPVRIEDVIPNEAFAYEFATRQWIDLFDDWENSIAQLVELIAAAIDDQKSGHHTRASPGSAGDAAGLPSGKIGTAGAAPATAKASFTQRPEFRWAIILGLAIIVAAAITYETKTLSQQPSSSSPVADREHRDRSLATASQYLGCFRDQQINPTGLATTQGRDLNGFITNNPNMTSAQCLAVCSGQGLAYAATQFGTYCFCGTSFGRSGLANNCDMACGGDPAEMCGGVFANSVYSVTGAKAR